MAKLSWKQHVIRRYLGKKGYPVVEILWIDAQSQACEDWQETIEHAAMPTTAVGYLIYEDVEVVTLIGLINQNHVAHGITIPKISIQDRRIL